MPSYSSELKAQIVRKMLPPNRQSVASLSLETGISTPTLYAWKKQFRNQGFVVPTKPTAPDGWDAKAKLAALLVGRRVAGQQGRSGGRAQEGSPPGPRCQDGCCIEAF